MKFSHVNLVARDTDRLADFYKTVFGCDDLYPRNNMAAESMSRCNGVPNAEIYRAWLSEIKNFGYEETPSFYVYARDPEGNVVELEQPSV